MFAKLTTCTIIGIEAIPVQVEIDISRGITAFNIVGLGDKAIQESKERIAASFKNSNIKMPRGRITINLAPANIPKYGPGYDLSIAMGILSAAKTITIDNKRQFFIGEISLNGELRKVNGVLTTTLFARDYGFKEIILPEANAHEASLVKDIKVIPVRNLSELIDYLNKKINIEVFIGDHTYEKNSDAEIDFKYIRGQEFAKRALTIAAAGGHNILLSGPPGAGKTMLARAIVSILPKLSFEESLEVTNIYSVCGLLHKDNPIISTRPFRSPHHTSSAAAIVGGGKIPRPGEISLSHRGVLFLDEFPEFSSQVLESLRQPLEDKVITVARATTTSEFPADFTLIAAMNPCKCGWLGDPDKECVCNPRQIINYQRKVSGPILDRIDLQVKVKKLNVNKLQSSKDSESSANILNIVTSARIIQSERYSDSNIYTNSGISQKEINNFCALDTTSKLLMRQAINTMNLSARSYYKILRIARTIADIEMCPSINEEHIAEALSFRFTDYQLR